MQIVKCLICDNELRKDQVEGHSCMLQLITYKMEREIKKLENQARQLTQIADKSLLNKAKIKIKYKNQSIILEVTLG